MNLKTGYNAREIADMRLSILPQTTAGVTKRAKKEGWQSRKRKGRGGGFEYAFESLPAAVQAEIKQKTYKSLVVRDEQALAEKRALRETAVANRNVKDFDNWQREVADARMRMTLLVNTYEAEMSRTKAVQHVSALSRDTALPVDELTDWNAVCTAAAAHNRKGSAGIGTRKLHEWVNAAEKCETAEDRLKALAPAKQGQPVKKLVAIDWLSDFMAVYRNTNGLCVARAYRQFEARYSAKYGADNLPSLGVVHRALNKMPAYVREAGRVTGAELKAMKTYVKRDWSLLKNNDVWVGDGHSMKLKVKHPIHGHPFTPELTVIMDAASRYIVGWSVSFSESQIAVADALRHGMVNHGIPAIYYSDNGAGQKNKTFDADITGILPRLGVHHETGIPGNPQGRGIIERFMKEAPNLAAQQFATYYGAGADRETTRKTLVAVKSLAKAEAEGKTGDELTDKQKWAKGKMPHWDELLEMVEAAITWYNTKHLHSSIGKTTPQAMRHALQDKYDNAPVRLSEAEAADMYRPAFERVVQRAWLAFDKKDYWHKDLEPRDGETVVLYVDQHDPSSVIVRDLKGKYICEAQLDGNKRAAFAKSLVESKAEERAKRAIERKEAEIALAKAEMNPAIEADSAAVLHELVGGAADKPKEKELAMFVSDLEAGEAGFDNHKHKRVVSG